MLYKFFFRICFVFLLSNTVLIAQTDYNNMSNWAYHPSKTGTALDGFNLNIAVIDKNLNTTSVISVTNNAMVNTGVDVFFVHPTVLQNMFTYTTITTVPIASQSATMVGASIRGQAGLLAKYGRFFAPRYQQATPPTFISSPLDNNQATVLGVAYNDVKSAFLNYIQNHNNGNKIIIASHSQGAYLAAMLVRDVIDNDPQIKQKLVVAVIAGMTSNYTDPHLYTGGWWQNIPFCSQQNECGCVMNWRSYKEGQTPNEPQSSHPTLNPFVVSNGWVNNQLNLSQDWLMQDSLYYSNQPQPLRNFITLRTNVTFGGVVGYVAFDSLYQIRHLRSGIKQVGFVVQHTPKVNDQRPNLLLDEESSPAFSATGYHQKDYNIYTWALMQQIDLKLATCGITIGINELKQNQTELTIYPTPTNDYFFIKNGIQNQVITIENVSGKTVLSGMLATDNSFNIQTLNSGFYIVKTTQGIGKIIVIK